MRDAQMPWQWSLGNYLRDPEVSKSCLLGATKYEGKESSNETILPKT